MSWIRRSRPAWAVDGAETRRGREGWEFWDTEALARLPVVAEALTRLPAHPDLEYLYQSLGLSTNGGREWGLSFADEALTWFDLSAPDGTDIFEETLLAAPFTDAVERVDREAFVFTTPEVLTGDVVLAHCLDVCGEVFRALGEEREF